MNDAVVKIWGETVGAVTWDPSQGMAFFRYTPQFRSKNVELAPLKMPISNDRVYAFPELIKIESFSGLPGLLSDALPDKYGNQLINQWLAHNGRQANSMNPVEKLCFIGQRGMGALEFEPSDFGKKKKAFNLEIDTLVEASQKILDDRQTFKVDLSKDELETMENILRIGTSAGGARPKAIIAYNELTGQVKSGQLEAPKGFEHWLLKLDGVKKGSDHIGDALGYGRIEMAYSAMAKAAGIEMMESRLLEENGRAHFMTKRFDREGSSIKHHIQTFAALKHYDFDAVGQHSYEELFQTMRELRLSYPEAQQLYRRMVFNVLAMNRDDHAKNFAFRLKQNGQWHLAPAYDITYAFDPSHRWLSEHALTINGKVDGITKSDLMTVAKSMSIKRAGQIIEEVNEAILMWSGFAEDYGIETKKRKAIQKTFPHIS